MNDRSDMRQGGGRRERDHWRIGKDIPVALIATLIVQAAAIVWFFADQAAALRTLTGRMAAVEVKVDSVITSVQSSAVPNAKIETKMEFLESRLNELRSTLSDDGRRISALEARSRAARER